MAITCGFYHDFIKKINGKLSLKLFYTFQNPQREKYVVLTKIFKLSENSQYAKQPEQFLEE